MDEDFYDTLRAQVLVLQLLPITFAKNGGEIYILPKSVTGF